MTISPESFAMICFLVLMQNGEGLIDKSPDYITEKTYMLRAGLDAFSFLDIHNMGKVVAWHEEWKVELPEKVANEYKMQVDAWMDLKSKGFEI